MGVVTGQLFAHLPVANYQCIMDLPQVCDLYNVSKFTNFVVLVELDTVRCIRTFGPPGILTVVHKLEGGEKDDSSGRVQVVWGGDRASLTECLQGCY